MQALVDILHEAVEMHPALVLHRGEVEEQVHQHRLAAPDLPDHVDPARPRRSRLRPAPAPKAQPRAQAAEQAGTRGRPLHDHRVVVAQFAPQPVQAAGRLFLFRVAVERARRNAGLVHGEGAGIALRNRL
ncbi:hypothetical protein KMAL_32740 [Novacetimonas maltaceti]|uniref:Uncharacterized protein n=1 Tax=Novacetimonas maltaceti TaxID=1203393 RepID=A0A2S3VXS7_9PROT|nr:hypothetical protein KMAL_32740 [Novacetimonas maltaceti]